MTVMRTDLRFLVAEINTAGLKVNNLFQIEDGRWQANLYNYVAKQGYEFAVAADPVDALQACFDKIKPTLSAPPQADDISDLL